MKKLPGVAAASADPILLALLCEHDASLTPPSALVDAITAAGFGAELVLDLPGPSPPLSDLDTAFDGSGHGELH